MEYENVLLVGGAFDGEWRSVAQGQPRLELAVLPRVASRITADGANPATTVAYAFEAYELTQLHGDGARYRVYVAQGVNVIEALISGYRKPLAK